MGRPATVFAVLALIAGLVTAYAGLRTGEPGPSVALLLAMAAAGGAFVRYRRAG